MRRREEPVEPNVSRKSLTHKYLYFSYTSDINIAGKLLEITTNNDLLMTNKRTNCFENVTHFTFNHLVGLLISHQQRSDYRHTNSHTNECNRTV